MFYPQAMHLVNVLYGWESIDRNGSLLYSQLFLESLSGAGGATVIPGSNGPSQDDFYGTRVEVGENVRVFSKVVFSVLDGSP